MSSVNCTTSFDLVFLPRSWVSTGDLAGWMVRLRHARHVGVLSARGDAIISWGLGPWVVVVVVSSRFVGELVCSGGPHCASFGFQRR